jgi:histidyl-tRNA synthetase
MQTLPQPVMLYSYGPTFRHDKPQLGRWRQFRQFNLEILGTSKSVADALIIRTITTILEEFGFKDLIVDINTMGDKETRPAFIKELTTYYKKHLDILCKDCHERIKSNPLRLLDCKQPECQPLKENAPSSLSFLSNDARSHFKEVLQYLEEMGIAYRINNSLVRGQSYYTRTVFEVMKVGEDGKEITVTGGGRYDNLAKMMGSKKDVSAVGTGLSMERTMMFPECKKLMPRIMKTPKVYFIQLGFEAKLKSLCVMETLRKARIPVYQSISKDSLGAQLSAAEKMEVPYCIIFGQKEAMDNTVIVRHMTTRSQDTVKIDALSDYIKHLK